MKECPACHAFNHDEANFCAVCGVKFAPSEDARDASPAAETSPADPAKYGKNEISMPAYNKENMQTDFSVPVIQNDTPMTPATIKELCENTRNMGFILLACGAVLILLNICTTLFLPELSDSFFLYLGIAFFTIGIVFILLYHNSLTKNKLFTDTSHALYVCDEKGMIQYMYDKDRKTGEQLVSFNQISKVEAKGHFLMIFFGSTFWPVDRRTFIQGTEIDFLNLLRYYGVNVKVK